jgi:WD40 repeat protein
MKRLVCLMATSLTVLCAAIAGASAAPQCPSNVLYVSSDFGHEVLRYDATTGQYIDTFVSAAAATGLNQPHGILDRGTDVLVASFGTDQVLRYDRNTGALLGVFIDSTSGLNDPVYILVGPDGNLYVSSQASDEVLRYDSSGTLIDAFVSAGAGGLDGPSGMAFGPDGRFYVAGRYSADVIVYDGATGAFDEVLVDSTDGLASGNTFGLQFGDNGDLYFVSNNLLFRYDVDTDSIVTTIGFGFPIGLEPGPSGGIFVADNNNLSIVNTGDNSVSGSFLTGGSINLLNFFHFSNVQVPGMVGDSDCDGDIDLDDYASMHDCLAGPDTVPPVMSPDCLDIFDADTDGDVDLADANAFWLSFSGP